MAPRLYTAGYERRSLEGLLAALRAHGIGQVADIRGEPESRKPGFGAEELRAALEARGLRYLALPALGCTRELRAALRAGGGRDAYLAGYEALLEARPGAREAYEALKALARAAPTLALCTERRPEECHRSALAARLIQEGFEVRELWPRGAATRPRLPRA